MASITSISAFEEWFENAASPGPEREIPSSVVIAVDRDGIIYTKSVGTQSENPTSPLASKPISSDTVMWVASCTKLLTSISLLQLVERGLLSLDVPVASLLPELSNPSVFTGFNSAGAPEFTKPEMEITVRMMMSHQSGEGYDIVHPYITQLRDYKYATGEAVPDKLSWESQIQPLKAQPGTSWVYGANFELLSRLVERVSGTPSLGAYMKEHIWDPLGITDATFHLASRPEMKDQIMDMSTRNADGKVVPSALGDWWTDRTFDSGGAGLYITPAEYSKVLRAILRDDGLLLKPETMELLFEPQLSSEAQKAFESTLYDNGGVAVLSSSLPRSARTTQALGGTVCREDVYGDVNGGDGKRRNKGSLNWGGLPSVLWMVDRERGLGMVWGTQLMPTGDGGVLAGWRRAEEAVYASNLGGGRAE
ncbi:hypothetical protein V496_03395 [Pseudogymnoascus sp. VKM F-4515 (FW-2607)]|nr:hypothetical protein V496_03395 [Pseudogymnoascus sp. VKM F-4515 (FW-2607)]KFZ00108.1 hypothetical protein V498_00291 [Pseudogymnoascus sp. VKM F-4517 (FW-2822)]